MTDVAEIIDTYTEGDTLPTFDRNHAKGLVDVTGWVIDLHLRQPGGTIIKRTATITNGPAGDFSFSFLAGDLEGGDDLQEAEIQFNTGSGTFTEAGLYFKIRKQIF